MNNTVNKLPVDFEVVKETQKKTLWDLLTEQQKDIVKHHTSEFSVLYESVIPSLKNNNSHYDLTIMEYQQILRCLGHSLISWINPYDVFKYDN